MAATSRLVAIPFQKQLSRRRWPLLLRLHLAERMFPSLSIAGHSVLLYLGGVWTFSLDSVLHDLGAANHHEDTDAEKDEEAEAVA